MAPMASEGVAHGSGDVERCGGEFGVVSMLVDRGGRCRAVAVVRLLISSEIRCFVLGIYGECEVIFNGSSCLRSHLGNVRLLLCDSAAKGGRLIRGFIDGERREIVSENNARLASPPLARPDGDAISGSRERIAVVTRRR